MKKLLVAVAIAGFCTDAGALFSRDTLQGIASVITATKGNNNFQQQGYQNGVQQWNFAQQQGGFAQQNTNISKKVQNNPQLQAVLAQNSSFADSQDIVRSMYNPNQIQGYVTKKGMIVNPQGIVMWGPQGNQGQKVDIPKKIQKIFETAGIQGYAGTPLNQAPQWGSSQTLVNSQSNLSLWNSQPMLDNGMPADTKAISRFLKSIEEMAEDLFTILEANIDNEKVRSLVLKLIKLMMQSCAQQAADRVKLAKMRMHILDLSRKADATSLAEKFDAIVKSTFKDDPTLFVSEDVEEREAERKKKQKQKQKQKAQVMEEEEEDNGYYADDEYGFDD